MIRAIFRVLPLPLVAKKHLKWFYFNASAQLGIVQRPALNGIDRKLEKYLPEKGFFIEAGANDGITQSNTWFFERYRGWSGLLVEPLPHLAAMAKRFRRVPVVETALTSIECDGSSVWLAENDLESHVTRANGRGTKIGARALSRILDEYTVTRVDFLSLDVEGFELNVENGIDFNRHAPRFILVETHNFEAVSEKLSENYDFREALSPHDYLFECRQVASGAIESIASKSAAPLPLSAFGIPPPGAQRL